MEIDKDLTWKAYIERMHCMAVYGQVGSNNKNWLKAALPYQEVIVPIICTPSSGLLLRSLEKMWGNIVWACGENIKLCTQSDSM